MIKEICRFCKQKFHENSGSFYSGNFVCNNCVDIMATALKDREEMINNTIAIQKETGVNLLPYKCKRIK
jgi:hypothetical protein